jgi:DMSO/TMAO reductase YedYZ molybdopterin-dependent catalytic subunit
LRQLRENGKHGFMSRRGFIQVAAALGLELPFARWFEQWKALGYRPEAAKVTPFITPNDDFYLVAVEPSFRPSFGPDNIDSNWSLKLAGVDGASRAFSYRELLARAERRVYYTFECIGNEVGGQLIGNAQWHVIPLKELLSQAPGGTQDARSVMFRGLDDFYSSISAQRALDDAAFVALRMNGVPLPAGHGFPARVLLPDLYGMKQPRWLRSLSLQPTPATTSFWEERGWAGEVPVKTMSRLDPAGERPARAAQLSGIAFAGQRGIRKVEVSLDQGKTWVDCQLETPERPGVWSTWRYRWLHPTAGSDTVQVRATDGAGTLQLARRQDPFPDGASGYDSRRVQIVDRP